MSELILGDFFETGFTRNSFELIFVDPPYNLQHKGNLERPEGGEYKGMDENWDKFANDLDYKTFTYLWLQRCQYLLKETGTIWVCGTYHNIYTVGSIMLDLGYWILNDIVWIKDNPTPNFRGVRFQHAHESLIWAQPKKGAKYTFNYKDLKSENNNLQMRDDWYIPVCRPPERIQRNGVTAHPSQKPLELLKRVIFSSTKEGDNVLDPFCGLGTTGKACQLLNRNYTLVEKEVEYYEIARDRLSSWAVEL